METPEQAEYYSNLPIPETPQTNVAPSPDYPPWQSWEAIGVWIASVLFIVIIPAIFLLPYLAMNGVQLTDSEALVEFAKTDAMSIVVQIAAIVPAHLLTVALAWLVVTRGRRFSFKEMLGWKSGGFAWWQYIAVLVGFGLSAVAVGNLIPEQENDLIRILKSSRMAVFMIAIVATLTAPFVEELVYRGVLYSAFQRAMGVPAAFLLVTFLFAVVHVPQYWPSTSTILLLTLLSMILTAIRVKTGNLLPCVIFHTIFNGFQSILLIIEPFFNVQELQQQTTSLLIK
ncbi:MAG: CPBP family intramembrane glutamic endopeptidase [Pyrinomonadaceae bacterium]